MNFRQRLLRYFIGVAIGVVIVFIMFPNHDWLSWTPGKQVMKTIREGEFYINENGRCYISCLGITDEDIAGMRNTGEVVFKQSDTKSSPKRYYVNYNSKAYSLLIDMSGTPKITLDKVVGETGCNCP